MKLLHQLISWVQLLCVIAYLLARSTPQPRHIQCVRNAFVWEYGSFFKDIKLRETHKAKYIVRCKITLWQLTMQRISGHSIRIKTVLLCESSDNIPLSLGYNLFIYHLISLSGTCHIENMVSPVLKKYMRSNDA